MEASRQASSDHGETTATLRDELLFQRTTQTHLWALPLVNSSDLSNWLPAPNGDFSLYLRAYWPGTELLDVGRTTLPVEKARIQ
jgi:hypothetical protein